MNLIVTTHDELQTLIEKAVQKALSIAEGSPKSQEQFIPIEEAAKLLNLAKATIYSMVSRREIPHYKKGKRLYFKPAELHEWIAEKKVKSYSELEQEYEEKGYFDEIKKGGRK